MYTIFFPYWTQRQYGFDGQLGREQTLAECLAFLMDMFEKVRRVLKPMGSLWLICTLGTARDIPGR